MHLWRRPIAAATTRVNQVSTLSAIPMLSAAMWADHQLSSRAAQPPRDLRIGDTQRKFASALQEAGEE
jgi:hypothetical protein